MWRTLLRIWNRHFLNCEFEILKFVYLERKSREMKLLEIFSEDVLLFSMPVYGGFIPQSCAKMARNLKGSNTPAIIAAVYGNRHYDDALLQMKDILTEQGFHVIAAGAFIAEHSVFPSVATGRPDDKDDGFSYEGVPFKPDGDDKCVACGECRKICPQNAISEGDFRKTNNELCIACGACIKVCPVGARNYHCDVYEEVRKDFEKMCSEYRVPELFYIEEAE